ncbi:MAG: PDZ domain-containing protein [Candidatus Aminicenantes bacterium]|nr:PDZ domain-containing protein [Candidatus Aminicenantes bacterium]
MSRLQKLFFFVVIIFIVFYLMGGPKVFDFFSEKKIDHQYLSLFAEIAGKTKRNYFENVQPGQKFPGAYTGMLRSLDKSSAYLNPRQTAVYDLYRSGTYCSTGIYGVRLSGYFYISDVVKDSPAQKAGLIPGDVIKTVGDNSLYALPYYQMHLSLLSAEPGDIQVSVYKKAAGKTIKINLQTQLSVSSARVKEIAAGKLLVELPKIDKTAVKYLKEKLKNTRPLKLIIDLRRYSGGDFASFLEIAGIFFNDRLLQPFPFPLTLKKKKGSREFLLGSKDAPDYKAVVIVNRSTIMYGELLALLFKNCKQGVTLIGAGTPGFISKLKQVKFDDGSSVLLSEGFFLVGGKNAAGSGVTPHIELKNKEFANILDRCTALMDEEQQPHGK